MSRPRLHVLLALVVLVGACRDRSRRVADPESEGDAADETHREQIGASMRAYVDALAASDPEAAASWVATTTFAFYEGLRELALVGDRESVEAHSMMEVVMVIELRARYSKAELEKHDGRTLFDQAVRDGMQAQLLPLDEVWVDEAAGRAEIRDQGQAVVWLIREQGRWVIDLPTMILGLAPLIEAEYAETIAEIGKLRVAYLLVDDGLADDQSLDVAIMDGPLE